MIIKILLTRIIIDSASDMPKKEADALKLDFLPLKTIFGEEEFLDGITITHDEFYTKLENSTENPSTSQISPAEYEDVYEDVKRCGDTAVVITLSSKLSGTYQSANIARDGYEDCIYIVDSTAKSYGKMDFSMPCAYVYSGHSDELLQKYIKDIANGWEDQPESIPVYSIGSTIGTHVGPGHLDLHFL